MSLFAALAPAGINLVSSIFGGNKASKDRKRAAQAAAAAAAQNKAFAETEAGNIRSSFDSFGSTGESANNLIANILHGRTDPSSTLEQMPGFQFRIDQANDALDRRHAATGLLNSGAAIDDIANLNQGLASSEFNNFLANLFRQSQMGLQARDAAARNSTPLLAAAMGANADMGNVNAAGIIGAGDAMTQGITSGLTGLSGALQAGAFDNIFGGSRPAAGGNAATSSGSKSFLQSLFAMPAAQQRAVFDAATAGLR